MVGLLDRFPEQVSSILEMISSDGGHHQLVLTAASCDPDSWSSMVSMAQDPVLVLTSVVDVLVMKDVDLVSVASGKIGRADGLCLSCRKWFQPQRRTNTPPV